MATAKGKKTAQTAAAQKAPPAKAAQPKATEPELAKAAPPRVQPEQKAPARTALAGEGSALVGRAAPAFKLADATGQQRTLADYRGRWTVLYFYPRDDTPGCTTEACEFTTLWDDFAALEATVVGVSPDTPERHTRFINKFKLKVALLSDPSKAMLSAYGAYGMKMMYGKQVEGVLRSTVILDPAGKIAQHFRGVKATGHAEAVREALKRLQGG